MMIFALALAACVDPVDRGAIPDDSVSDRVAIQSSIDSLPSAGGVVCLGPGRWTVDRAPVGSYNRMAALSTHGRHLVIRGSGPATVLELAGDQREGTVSVISVDPSAEDIRISNLTIDTSQAYNTDEQTHAIQIGSSICAGTTCAPIRDVVIEHVRFVHPRGQDGSRKGDCVRLLGNTPATMVLGVRILGSTFAGCARSGVSIQRNVHQVVVQASSFRGTGDQDIDSEPTGGVADLNSDVQIVGNLFHDPIRTSQGDHAVTVGGIVAPMDRVIVASNIFNGRGLGMYRTANVTVTGNVFRAQMMGAAGVIHSANVLEHAIISSNIVSRSGYPGPLIRATPQSGGLPTDILIDGNDLTNHTDGPGIYLESANQVAVRGNAITWKVSAPSQAGVYMRATTADVNGIAVNDNQIRAPDLGWAVFLAAAPNSIGRSIVVGNVADGARVGLFCSETAPGVLAAVVFFGNSLGPLQCSQITTGD